jgi:hypothetical protein
VTEAGRLILPPPAFRGRSNRRLMGVAAQWT